MSVPNETTPEQKAKQKAEEDAFYAQHEEMSSSRVVAFQKSLDSALDSDKEALDKLQRRLELQVKIEEYIVRWREAEHPKWKVYGPLVLSIFAFVISVVSLFVKSAK